MTRIFPSSRPACLSILRAPADYSQLSSSARASQHQRIGPQTYSYRVNRSVNLRQHAADFAGTFSKLRPRNGGFSPTRWTCGQFSIASIHHKHFRDADTRVNPDIARFAERALGRLLVNDSSKCGHCSVRGTSPGAPSSQ
jgi:hypothetical protein